MADFTLVVQDAVHAQTADNVTLVQHNVLVVANATHAQITDNIVLVVPFARTSNIAIGFEYLDYDAVRTSTIALMIEYTNPPPRILGPAIQNH
jgi:hypothetical protein